jgi:phospholipid/cholesterol/gamma-HCH transport system substrate-binding protein
MSPVVPASRWARVLAAAALVLLVAAAGVGVWWYLGPHQEGTRFAAMFPESVGIYPGSDVRVLGVAVGKVDAVTPEGTAVKVSMHLNRGIAVRSDTRAVIISPSLVSDRYVQLTGVYNGGPKLTSGALIPLARTATSVEIDQLTQGLVQLAQALGPNGANKHGALADLLNVGAANLRGNGAALNAMLDQFSRNMNTLSGNRVNLFRTLDNLARFTGTLASNDQSVRGLNSSLANVSQVLAQDRQSFTDAMHQLSTALLTVKQFIQQNRGLISANVAKLAVITQALMNERNSLAQALRAAPLAVDNVINAYDPTHHTLDGRANLNELSLWPTRGGH